MNEFQAEVIAALTPILAKYGIGTANTKVTYTPPVEEVSFSISD